MPTITIHLPYGGKKGDKSKSKRDYMSSHKTMKRKASGKKSPGKKKK